jgi:DNA modification methylase
MEEIKGNFGKVILCDNMDKEYGLPSLKDQSFDLCLTDPPYNLNYDPKKTNKKFLSYEGKDQNSYDSNEILYNDLIPNYEEFSKNWFESISRITNERVIFTCGNPNLQFWMGYKKPVEILIMAKENGGTPTNYVRFSLKEFILVYGFYKSFTFQRDVIKIINPCGFLKEGDWIHPSPKPLQLYREILKQVNPKSVIDPFMGSGTTAQVCEELGIKYLGYELNIDAKGKRANYDKDIQLRIDLGIEIKSKSTKQSSLFEF